MYVFKGISYFSFFIIFMVWRFSHTRQTCQFRFYIRMNNRKKEVTFYYFRNTILRKFDLVTALSPAMKFHNASIVYFVFVVKLSLCANGHTKPHILFIVADDLGKLLDVLFFRTDFLTEFNGAYCS